MKVCRMCGVDKALSEFTGKSSSPDGHANECRNCQKFYRLNSERAKNGLPPLANTPYQIKPSRRSRSGYGSVQYSSVRIVQPAPVVLNVSIPSDEEIDEMLDEREQAEEVEETKPDRVVAPGEFIQSPEVLATWVAVQKIAKSGGLAPNLFFKGPSGSGKTEAAKDLAARSELPFFKIDAPAMVDPEAWFGTREIVVEDGAPKTVYVPSKFVIAVQQPCVLLIDEANRVSDAIRQILLPLFDDSREVTNPLTGQVLVRHPLCFVVMTGNVGIAFTGTYAVDPALLTRALTTNFTYLEAEDEIAVVIARTGIAKVQAATIVRFAGDTRKKAATDDDFLPVSTREVLSAAKLVAQGLDMTTAIHQSVINAASEEGGAESTRAQLEYLWKGIYKA